MVGQSSVWGSWKTRVSLPCSKAGLLYQFFLIIASLLVALSDLYSLGLSSALFNKHQINRELRGQYFKSRFPFKPMVATKTGINLLVIINVITNI
jgi:hypothetical protein